MKSIVSLVIFGLVCMILLPASGQIPGCLWVQSACGKGDNVGSGVAVDGAGNCYITGSFCGAVQFSGHELASAGGRDR
ncbi:MAG: hypothetical protein M1608_15785 [Candidatus Omnitrophica bacterium]|nr:hypothetical protein [Candidatus Omnitrophota bacterium]